MIDEFRPLSLTDAAKRLGVEPFELVRLAVVFDEETDNLRFPADAVERIREHAGIADLWSSRELPPDDNPVRAAVRGACRLLVDHRLVGQASTRLDNLSRGMSALQVDAVDEAATVLAEEGVLLLVASDRGLQVSIAPGAEGTVAAIADGTGAPEGLAALWAG